MRNAKKPRKKAKNKSGKRVLKITLLTVLMIILLAGVTALGVGFAMIKTAPPLDIDKILSLNEPARFYDSKGNLIDEYKTEERRDLATYEEIPQVLRDAFLSAEDRRFYEHDGIDYIRLMGSMKYNMQSILGVGNSSGIQGASTITMQLIKQQMFLESSLEDRLDIERKVQEMYLALEVEKKLDKDEILTAYMNTIPLGGNTFGVKAATDMYFSKNLSDLTLLEAAFLAGAVNSPSLSYKNAEVGYSEDGSFESGRTLLVLNGMLEWGKITQEQYNEATLDKIFYIIRDENDNKKFAIQVKNSTNELIVQTFDENKKVVATESQPLSEENLSELISTNVPTNYTSSKTVSIPFNFKEGNPNKMNYEWFSRAVIDQIYDDLRAQNKTDVEIADLLSNGGLKIYTTMDTNLQNQVQAILNDPSLYPTNGDGTPVQPDLQASAVIMDYRTGHVKTIVGGRGEQGPMSFNRAASEDFLRPPGSSIKPLTVYAPAIDTKVFTAGTIVEDSPVNDEFRTKYGVEQEVYPRNSPLGYRGYLNLRYGMKHSANTVAVKVVDKLGVDVSASYGEKFGIHLSQADMGPASLGLGQLSANSDKDNLSGANPLILATAYGAFGNSGLVCEPILYTKIEDKNGTVIHEPKFTAENVITPQTAYIMYDMLKEPVSSSGTGYNAHFGEMPVRGKTGTSGDGRDLTFAGLTPYYSAAVWVGNDDNEKIEYHSYYGSNSVARIWSKIMEVAHVGLEPKNIEMPDGIAKEDISKDSGTLPTNETYDDPRGNRVYSELFIDGTQPTTYDDVHVRAKVVKKSDGSYVLPNEYSSKFSIVERVFITRDYKPSVTLEDQAYVLPTEVDDAKDPFQEIIDNIINGDKDKDDDKDKDKDNDKDKETEEDKDTDTTPDVTDPEGEGGDTNNGNTTPDGSNPGGDTGNNNGGDTAPPPTSGSNNSNKDPKSYSWLPSVKTRNNLYGLF